MLYYRAMNSTVKKISGRLFVGLYVLYGYAGYYLRRLSYKKVGLGLMLMFVIAGISFKVITRPKLTGNDALNNAYDAQNRGRIHDAHKHFEQAYTLFEKDKNGRGMLLSLNRLAEMDMAINDFNEAIYHYDTALRLSKKLNYLPGQITYLSKLGDTKLRKDARVYYTDAIKIAADIDAYFDVAALYTKIGNLERDYGDVPAARTAYEQAMTIYGTHANNKGEATLTWNVAALENKLNDYENAQIAYGRARDLFKLSGDIFNEATVVKHLARLEKNNGKTDEAAKLYNEAATLYTSIGNKKALADLKSEAEQLL